MFAGAGREHGGGSMKVFTPARQVRSGNVSGTSPPLAGAQDGVCFPFPDFYSVNSTLTHKNLTAGNVSSSSQQIHSL